MLMHNNYNGVIWTNHALSRLSQRGISQSDAWYVWRRPDTTRYAASRGGWVYAKTLAGEYIEVVAKKNEKGEWIVLSVWSKKIKEKQKVAPKRKSFWQILFGGFVQIVPLILLAGAALVIILSQSIGFSKKEEKKENNNIATALSTSTPAPSESPQSPTTTPTVTSNPTAVPTKAPTATPVINNNPPNSGYSRQSVATEIGTFTVSLIAADISNTRVIVDTASTTDCTSNCPVLSLSDYVSRNNAFAGINGTYFCPVDYPTCAGKENSFDLLVMNKDKYYFNSANNVYSVNPAVIFGSGYIKFVRGAQEWGRDTGVNGVISNFPLLVFNTEITFTGDGDPKKGSKGARSFVANKGNNVYIGVVHSATVAESAVVLKKLGMDNAMNLDNGGSTALWFGGYKLGPGRKIPNAILFTR